MKIDLRPSQPKSHFPAARTGLVLATWLVAVCGFEYALGKGQPWLIPAAEFTSRLTRHAHDLAGRMDNRTLALNFLGNLRYLTSSEAAILGAAGLTHLLAISGGQIGLIADFASRLTAVLLQQALHRHLDTIPLLRLIARARRLAHLCAAMAVAAAFGQTGALLRAGILGFGQTSRLSQRAALAAWSLVPAIPVATLQRLGLLTLVVPFLGNPFYSLSFLLSAAGAATANLASRVARRLPVGRLASWILTTTLTCAGMQALLHPVLPSDPLVAILANVVAIPLVSFVITPLSLAALLCPNEAVNNACLLPLLDASLGIFHQLARLSAGLAGPSTVSPRALQDEGTRLYLIFALILLWAIQDLVEERSNRLRLSLTNP